MRGSAIRGVALFGVEETRFVPEERLGRYLAASRLAGGRLRRSVFDVVDGVEGYQVTFAYRDQL